VQRGTREAAQMHASWHFLKFEQPAAHALQHRTFNPPGISWHVATRRCGFCSDIQKAQAND